MLCTVGPGSAGTHDVILHVLGLGAAVYFDAVLQFTYNFSLYDVTPLTAGLGGTQLRNISNKADNCYCTRERFDSMS